MMRTSIALLAACVLLAALTAVESQDDDVDCTNNCGGNNCGRTDCYKSNCGDCANNCGCTNRVCQQSCATRCRQCSDNCKTTPCQKPEKNEEFPGKPATTDSNNQATANLTASFDISTIVSNNNTIHMPVEYTFNHHTNVTVIPAPAPNIHINVTASSSGQPTVVHVPTGNHTPGIPTGTNGPINIDINNTVGGQPCCNVPVTNQCNINSPQPCQERTWARECGNKCIWYQQQQQQYWNQQQQTHIIRQPYTVHVPQPYPQPYPVIQRIPQPYPVIRHVHVPQPYPVIQRIPVPQPYPVIQTQPSSCLLNTLQGGQYSACSQNSLAYDQWSQNIGRADSNCITSGQYPWIQCGTGQTRFHGFQGGSGSLDLTGFQKVLDQTQGGNYNRKLDCRLMQNAMRCT